MATHDGPNRPRPAEKIVLRLYVAGNAPNSSRARANLAAILSQVPADRYELEIIDVFVEPLRALQDGVLVTPTLVRISPLPAEQIIGDLSDAARVGDALGMNGGADGPA